AGSFRQRCRAASGRELERLAQRLPCRGTCVRAPQRAAKVDERSRAFEPSWRVFEHRDRLAKQSDPSFVGLNETERARRDADRPRSAEAPGEAQFIAGELDRAVAVAESHLRERGLRPPGYDRGVV